MAGSRMTETVMPKELVEVALELGFGFGLVPALGQVWGLELWLKVRLRVRVRARVTRT